MADSPTVYEPEVDIEDSQAQSVIDQLNKMSEEIGQPDSEETPSDETSKEETPKEETPKEETPKEETPKEETPKEETPSEDLENLFDQQKETSEGWKQTRQTLKENASQLKEKDQQIQALKEQLSSSEKKPEATAEQAFGLLLQLNSGEGAIDESRRADIEDELELHTADEVADVVRKARRGMYGDSSEDILTLAQGYLPTAQYNDSVRGKRQRLVNEFFSSRNESLKRIKEKPGMNDRNSAEFQNYMKTLNSLRQQSPQLELAPDFPEIVYKFSTAESSNGELEQLRAENAKLRQQLNVSGAPQTGTRASQPAQNKELDPDEELKQFEAGMRSNVMMY